MSGTGEESLEEKLKKEVFSCNWNMIAPHFAKGSVVFIDKELSVVEVGVALAENNVELVKKWQEVKLLREISDDEALEFSKDSSKNFGHFLIVQPFVIIKSGSYDHR